MTITDTPSAPTFTDVLYDVDGTVRRSSPSTGRNG